MKIAVIGSGGREHALAWKLSQSPQCERVYCIPGNGGTASIATNVDIDILDFDTMITYAKKEGVDLTIVGPEVPLCEGIVDAFEKEGLKIFGPNKRSAKLEGSKEFSKEFMNRHDIKTAKHISVTSFEEGVKALDNVDFPCVVKADGLCAGKGVIISNTYEEAKTALNDIFLDSLFGDQGNTVVIEEYLDGYEVSQLCFVSKNKLYPLETSQDYKRIGENDTGDNTGGVGCLSPSPRVNPSIFEAGFKKIEKGLKEEELEFYGILFIGYMVVGDTPYILEFNARFGDPETEVLIPRLKNDLVQVFLDVMNDKDPMLEWDERKALAIVLTSEGYPHAYEKGKVITIKDTGLIFHNGTEVDGDLKTVGGRVLTLVSLGDDYPSINKEILRRIEDVDFEGKTFRTDIGL